VEEHEEAVVDLVDLARQGDGVDLLRAVVAVTVAAGVGLRREGVVDSTVAEAEVDLLQEVRREDEVASEVVVEC
jgi:hypothetical protein